MRILVVEDEKNMNRLIAADYDVIILDVNLPKLDGFTVVSRLRDRECMTPVLFLTARDSVADKVTGLGSGIISCRCCDRQCQ